jgi:preprotein translocase SecE subunit
MMNKPSNVDFLIATDSEMKKVNWTSRKDLIGSTKVVIIFMFLIAFFLFVIDVVFSYFFFLIGVLRSSPFGGGGTIGGG